MTHLQSFKERRVWLWAYAPVLLWICVIFFLSSNSGSMDETSRIIGPILRFLFPEMTDENRRFIHAMVRKSAHFTEYAILAFFTARALASTASGLLLKWRYCLPLLLVAIIAAADEFNQSFEASRTSSVWDSLLDISGGAAMLIFLWVIGRPRIVDRSEDG